MISIFKRILEANRPQLVLMLGTLLSQSFSLINLVVLARFLDQASYGHYSLTLVVMATLMPLTTRKIEAFLVTAAEIEINSMLRYALRRVLILSFPYSVVLSFVSFHLWHFSFSKTILFFISVYFANLVINLSILAIALCLRTRNFRAVSINGILQNSFTLVFQLFVIQFDSSIPTLVFAYFIGRLIALGSFLIWVDFRSSLKATLVISGSMNVRRNQAKNHVFYSSILEQISLNSPVLYSLLINDQSLLGLSALALSLVLAPSTFVISSFSMQFLSHQHAHEKEKGEIIKYGIFTLITLCIIYLSIMTLFSMTLADEIFGEKWRGISDILIAFSIPVAFLIFITPYLQLLISQGESRIVMKTNIAGVAGVVFVCMFGFMGASSELVVSLLLFGKVLGQLLGLGLTGVKRKT